MLAAEEYYVKNPVVRARYVDGGQRADRAVVTALDSDRLERRVLEAGLHTATMPAHHTPFNGITDGVRDL
jgi:hypothetical protein